MNFDLLNIIKDFCDKFELEYLKGEFKLILTDNVADYIRQKDYSYYTWLKKPFDPFGMCYVDPNEEYKLLVDTVRQNLPNIIVTTLHEYTHLGDYMRYGQTKPTVSRRNLQEDDTFRYWSEFHASYLSHMFVFSLDDTSMDYERIGVEILQSYQEAIKQDTCDREYAVYESVHKYGEYIALQERYPIINSHPINFYINDTFRNIYDFLFTHRTIDKFLKDYQEYDKLINQI